MKARPKGPPVGAGNYGGCYALKLQDQIVLHKRRRINVVPQRYEIIRRITEKNSRSTRFRKILNVGWNGQ